MDLIGLTDVHVLAMMPLILRGELGVIRVVLVASPTKPGLPQTPSQSIILDVVHLRAHAFVGVFADGVMLGAEVPMHIDWAKPRLKVRSRDWSASRRVDFTLVAQGDIRSRLFQSIKHTRFEGAIGIREIVTSLTASRLRRLTCRLLVVTIILRFTEQRFSWHWHDLKFG